MIRGGDLKGRAASEFFKFPKERAETYGNRVPMTFLVRELIARLQSSRSHVLAGENSFRLARGTAAATIDRASRERG